MSLLSNLRSLAGRLFHRSQIADEMEEELPRHIQHRADDLERSGLNRAEAERRARIEFGGRERFKEESTKRWAATSSRPSCTMCASRFAYCASLPDSRSLPFLTLALAIGANAVVFAVLNALILRPLNVPHAESLYGNRARVDNPDLAVVSRLSRSARSQPQLRGAGSLYLCLE